MAGNRLLGPNRLPKEVAVTSLLPPDAGAVADFHVAGAAHDDVLVVTLSGEVDIATRRKVDDFVALEVDACPGTLVIDLAAVTFVDSTGLSMLVTAQRAVAAKGGRVVVRHPSAQFRALLHMTGVDGLVTVED